MPVFQRGGSFLAASCKKNFSLQTFEPRILHIAEQIERARSQGQQISSSNEWRIQGLSQDEAYAVSAACCAMRMQHGPSTRHTPQQFPVGRKIGFTNKSIWPEYNIDASNWGYMYSNTVHHFSDLPRLTFGYKTMLLQPRIEPEIVFRMKSAPSSSMSDAELLDCILWFAHGFEIVQSVYPDWKFTSAETTAAGALHQDLLVGQTIRTSTTASKEQIITALSDVEVSLFRTQFQRSQGLRTQLMDRGGAKKVLGNPLNALRHLCKLLENQSLHPRIQPREIITTGTMTKAMPILNGDRWHTTIEKSDFGDVAEKGKHFQSIELNIPNYQPGYLRKRVGLAARSDRPAPQNST